LVRQFSSEESEYERCKLVNSDPRRPYRPSYAPAAKGLNHWNWRGDRDGFSCVENTTLFAGLRGAPVPPGRYTARISANGQSDEVSFELLADPRRSTTPEQSREWQARLDETSALLERLLGSLGELRKTERQIETLMETHPYDDDLKKAGNAALEAIEAWDHKVIQPLHQTLEDEDAWETMLAGQLRFLLDVIASTGAPVTQGALDRLADLSSQSAALEREKTRIFGQLVAPINNWARDNNIPHVTM
jgi:hypothetical protein